MRAMKPVVDRILEQFPGDDPRMEEFRSRSNSIVESSSFAAPEMQSHWWRELQSVMIDVLGEADTPWKLKIASIFAGRE